jgi:hypothetical protein
VRRVRPWECCLVALARRQQEQNRSRLIRWKCDLLKTVSHNASKTPASTCKPSEKATYRGLGAASADLLWASLAFGRWGRVSVFNETRQEDVHQGVGSTAIATGDDVRNEFEPAR